VSRGSGEDRDRRSEHFGRHPDDGRRAMAREEASRPCELAQFPHLSVFLEKLVADRAFRSRVRFDVHGRPKITASMILVVFGFCTAFLLNHFILFMSFYFYLGWDILRFCFSAAAKCDIHRIEHACIFSAPLLIVCPLLGCLLPFPTAAGKAGMIVCGIGGNSQSSSDFEISCYLVSVVLSIVWRIAEPDSH
jgi:hypothetical protein